MLDDVAVLVAAILDNPSWIVHDDIDRIVEEDTFVWNYRPAL